MLAINRYAGIEHLFHDRQIALDGAVVQRIITHLVPPQGVCTALEQHADHVGIAVGGGMHQQAVALLVLIVWVKACGQAFLHRIGIAALGGCHHPISGRHGP